MVSCKAASLVKDFSVSSLLGNFSTLLGLKRISKHNDKGLSYTCSRLQLRASWRVLHVGILLTKMRRVLLPYLLGLGAKARTRRNECKRRDTLTETRCQTLQRWKSESPGRRESRGTTPVHLSPWGLTHEEEGRATNTPAGAVLPFRKAQGPICKTPFLFWILVQILHKTMKKSITENMKSIKS